MSVVRELAMFRRYIVAVCLVPLGCTSFVLPPAAEEFPARGSPDFPYLASVAVASTGHETEDGCLLAALSQSGWFSKAGMDGDLAMPDLIAQVEVPTPR